MIRANYSEGGILRECRAEDVGKLHSKTEFSCPICRRELKLTQHYDAPTTHFFLHTEGGEHGETETLDHVQGKNLIAHLAKEIGFDSNVDTLVGDVVADVVITTRSEHVAVEYQCGAIDGLTIIRRSREYLKNGFVPIWILGSDFAISRDDEKHPREAIELYQKNIYYLSEGEFMVEKKREPSKEETEEKHFSQWSVRRRVMELEILRWLGIRRKEGGAEAGGPRHQLVQHSLDLTFTGQSTIDETGDVRWTGKQSL